MGLDPSLLKKLDFLNIDQNCHSIGIWLPKFIRVLPQTPYLLAEVNLYFAVGGQTDFH